MRYHLFKMTIKNLSDLIPDWDKGLDVICGGILDGKEFVYPAERMGL